LFFIFGTHKDNLKLWLKKLGVKKSFGQLFKSEIDMTKVQSVREKVNVSTWEGNTMPAAKKGSTFESAQKA
jgi:hypothetical protein